MSTFGERRGASSYSRDSLIRKQVQALRSLHRAAKEYTRPDGVEAAAQIHVNNLILLEQFPTRRISADQLQRLGWYSSDLFYGFGSPETILRKALAS